MTPQEKAEELVGKYLAIQFGDFPTTDAKQCALIAVDEALNSFYNTFDDFVVEPSEIGGYRNMKSYWKEVKQEIEKL